MNTAQHAGRILSAWQTANHPALLDALNGARKSCNGIRFMNRFESEKQEVLACVVEHLETLDLKKATTGGRCMTGAAALLAHLSSDSVEEGFAASDAAILTRKTRFPN